MQQFFCEDILNIGDQYKLNKEIDFQLRKVLRVNNGYTFRMVDKNHSIFLCEYNDGFALINSKLDEDNELDIDITVILALIKNDKFDFAVQKLTELGVKRIVPYLAKRSVVKPGKGNNKQERLTKIAREASEQSHRNCIPEICDYCTLKDLSKYKSDINIIAYEKDDKLISDLKGKSFTIVIGPEGGFAPEEYEQIVSLGFESVSLGKRILRAETAAIYLSSVIIGNNI